MKRLILCSVLALATATIIVSCEKASSVQQETGLIKANIRLVAIDSVSEARTEDKTLFVNVK